MIGERYYIVSSNIYGISKREMINTNGVPFVEIHWIGRFSNVDNNYHHGISRYFYSKNEIEGLLKEKKWIKLNVV